MSNIYITHYYFTGTDPWKNIMNLPEEEAFRMAEELSSEHPDTTSCGRFADFANYYPQRKKTDAYVLEEFIKLGGRPSMEHPFSFVLMESEYLNNWFSNGESFRIDLDDIPDEEVSFTIGDSCAQITNGLIPEVLTKKMLLERIAKFDSVEEFLKSSLGRFAYVEVQLWTDTIIRKLCADIISDYFNYFDNYAFEDGSPFYPCYCNAFNMSKTRIREEFNMKAKEYGGGRENWKRAIRESAERMVKAGEVQGYLAFESGIPIGWVNANDRQNYYRVGEFDLSDVPEDEACTYCEKGQIKSIVCFEISPYHRGKGLAGKLLSRVIEDAQKDGYKYVEAYPEEGGGEMGIAFTGPLRLYEKAGFEETERKGSTIVMRKVLFKEE